jgi:hypothetical protein
MELIFVVSGLAAAGLTISITAARAIWNKLAESKRWDNMQTAMNDQCFWHEFAKNAESQR